MTPNEDSGRVWKFVVPQPDEQGRTAIEVPPEAELLSVGMQGDDMVVWLFVSEQAMLAQRTRRPLIVANTGMQIDKPRHVRHLGTVTTSAGIVWHVWDAQELPPSMFL